LAVSWAEATAGGAGGGGGGAEVTGAGETDGGGDILGGGGATGGKLGGGLDGTIGGWLDTGGAEPLSNCAPQLSQNISPGMTALLHWGQLFPPTAGGGDGTGDALANGVPH